MINHRAEEFFRSGMTSLSGHRPNEALGMFRAAIEVQRQSGDDRQAEARYLSFYGLSLCITRHSRREALQCCRKAVEIETYRPALWWNLGRVALVSGRRAEAMRAFQHALQLQPGHRGVLRDMRMMGIRRPPVLRFLPRENPINVVLGRLRGGSRDKHGRAA